MSLLRRIFGLPGPRPVITELRPESGDAIAALGACHCSNGALLT